MLDSNKLLHELRELHYQLDASGEFSVVLVGLFVQKFKELDELLTDGGQFPYYWITKVSQTRLGNPTLKPAPCGHPSSANGERCVVPHCSNYRDEP